MSDEEETTVQVRVGKDSITISAPLTVSEAQLLEAAKLAHLKARRRLSPNRTQRADEMGFRAAAAHAGGASWSRVTDDLAKLTGRDDLDPRQVRRWAERWNDLAARLTDAANAELREVDTTD